MKHTIVKMVLVVFVVAVFAAVSFAADPAPPAKVPGQNFEKHKADVISRIDARIARNQEEKTCVQAAKSGAEIKACKEKFKAAMDEQRQQMKK